MFSMAINHNRARRTQALAIRKHHGSSRVCRQTHAHSHTHTHTDTRTAYSFWQLESVLIFSFFVFTFGWRSPTFFFTVTLCVLAMPFICCLCTRAVRRAWCASGMFRATSFGIIIAHMCVCVCVCVTLYVLHSNKCFRFHYRANRIYRLLLTINFFFHHKFAMWFIDGLIILLVVCICSEESMATWRQYWEETIIQTARVANNREDVAQLLYIHTLMWVFPARNLNCWLCNWMLICAICLQPSVCRRDMSASPSTNEYADHIIDLLLEKENSRMRYTDKSPQAAWRPFFVCMIQEFAKTRNFSRTTVHLGSLSHVRV